MRHCCVTATLTLRDGNSEGVGVAIAAPLHSLMTGLVPLLVCSFVMVVISVTAHAHPAIKWYCGADNYENLKQHICI